MNYEFDELTSEFIRTVGFRERYRGYDPADVDPLLEQLAARVEDVQTEIGRLAHQTTFRPKRRELPSLEYVAALAAMLHIGYAAREARAIVTTARKRTGLTRAVPERHEVNQERARALLYRPTSVD
jgi:DivIVA domain-containing protein